MSFDFSGMSLDALSRETLARAREVDKYNDAAWGTMPNAFCGAICVLGGTLFGGVAVYNSIALGQWPWMFLLIPAALLIAIGYSLHMPWARAMDRCSTFTAEMNARTEELNRRRAKRAPTP